MSELLFLRITYVLAWLVIGLAALAFVYATIHGIVLFFRKGTPPDALPLVGQWPQREVTPPREDHGPARGDNATWDR